LPEQARLIDHLVLPVTTLTLARSRLMALGFTVAPDARHPFGTGNCCVFFRNRTYLEPITIVDRAAADMAAAEGLFFVKRIKRFTERHGEGFAMVAVKSDDAAADAAAFEQAGIGAGPAFHFSRNAQLADGSERELGFVLAYAEDARVPDATLFACQHLAPDALYQPGYLEHPNGALGILAATAVAERPSDFGSMLSVVTSKPEIAASESEVDATIAGRGIMVLTPENFRARYGLAAPDARRGLLLAAFELAVDDVERAAGFAGATAKRHGEMVVVPPSPGLGAALAFRKDTDG
jgi:hypothetical protein